MSTVLPRAFEAVREILTQHGPLDWDDVLIHLRERQMVLGTRHLIRLREHGDVFVLDGERVALAGHVPVDPDPLEDVGAAGGLPLVDATTASLDDVRALVVVAMPPGEPASFTVGTSGTGVRSGLSAEQVVKALDRDKLILTPDAGRLPAVLIDSLPPIADLRRLSILLDPVAVHHDLAGLADRLGVVASGGSPQAEVALLLGIAGAARDRMTGPTWAVVRACLAAAGDPIARLVPEQRLGDIDAHLQLAHDPLVDAPAARAVRGARSAVSTAMRVLADAGFRDRHGQRTMMAEVAQTLDHGGRLAVEAPTGTGKTFGYLVPAAGRAAEGRPVVVATATKALQGQLRDDAAKLRDIGLLDVPFRVLHGVANHVCAREVVDTVEAGADDTDWLAVAVAVRTLATSVSGVWDDVADASFRRTGDYRRTRRELATTARECERTSCPQRHHCPLMRTLGGIDTDPGIVVANHALIASWTKLADRGHHAPGDVLSERRGSIILDEAHGVEDSLTAGWTDTYGQFTTVATARRIDGRRGPLRLLREAAAQSGATSRVAGHLAGVRQGLAAAVEVADELSETVTHYLTEFAGDGREVELMAVVVRRRREYQDIVAVAHVVLSGLRRARAGLADASRALADPASDRPPSRVVQRAVRRTTAVLAEMDESIATLQSMVAKDDEHTHVRTLSTAEMADGTPVWEYRRIPISIGPLFRRGVADRAHALVLTSATLAVGGTFDHLARTVGLTLSVEGESDPDALTHLRVNGPFDHGRQAMVVLTGHLPLPVPATQDEFVEDLAADHVGLLSLIGGRTLSLFASRARMDAVADLIDRRADELADRGVEVLVQGRQSPREIRERFTTEEGTALLGVGSYWEGFDAPGRTLSYLMIEKAPYPWIGDPVVRARQRYHEEQGRDPFIDYLVPRTAIRLAQGYGRLIRSEDDRGAVILCDRRLQVPSVLNQMLLSALPGPQIVQTDSREEAWTQAITFVDGIPPDLSTALLPPPDERLLALDDLRAMAALDPEAALREGARILFGIEELHDEQLTVMTAVLEGRDALGLLPTGFGKSLCFQLPALIRPDRRPTVVVSPLIALIKDQLADLRGRRGLRMVQGITGQTSMTERTEALRDLAEGRTLLLYVSPERLVRDPTLHGALRALDLGAVVVDEAHCISVWGHDFRPEFRQIAPALATFKRSARVGVTATATAEVAEDIAATLDMTDPVVVRAPVDRPNLRFWTHRCTSERERARQLLRFVAAQGDHPGIVYCQRRAQTEEVAGLLRRFGVTARHYHAGMVPEQRDAVQEAFLGDMVQVVVATKAFGMGINKADVGWVVHHGMPESVESYAQEAGRAARDRDMTGECLVLWSQTDVRSRRSVLARPDERGDLDTAVRLLRELRDCRRRGEDVVFDPEAIADRIHVEIDHLNVLVAWLERCDALQRKLDCSSRGMVSAGGREPEDPDERQRFRDICWTRLNVKPGTSRRVDLDVLEDEHGFDPDHLERHLVDWTLRRLVTFRSTGRRWRVQLSDMPLHQGRFIDQVQRWGRAQSLRYEQMVSYVASAECRRGLLLGHFGDTPSACGRADTACDNCAGGEPPWWRVPDETLPELEDVIDVELILLQTVAWASSFAGGRYSLFGLRLALAGQEQYPNGRPLSAGLLRCPQFGALRYVRAQERVFHETVATLEKQGLVVEEKAENGDHDYQSLRITDHGTAYLEGGA